MILLACLIIAIVLMLMQFFRRQLCEVRLILVVFIPLGSDSNFRSVCIFLTHFTTFALDYLRKYNYEVRATTNLTINTDNLLNAQEKSLS